jgi:hypothetical protein
MAIKPASNSENKVIVNTEKISFSLLPLDHDDRFTYTVNVEYRGNGNYAITRLGRCLNVNGEWELDSTSHIKSDEVLKAYITTHRFNYWEACVKARKLCRDLVVNKIPVKDVLEQMKKKESSSDEEIIL